MAMVRKGAVGRPPETLASLQVWRTILTDALEKKADTILLSLHSLLVGMLFWNYFLTVRTPPGSVPRNWVSSSNIWLGPS